jgi:exopolysaccharide biosynthesis protein
MKRLLFIIFIFFLIITSVYLWSNHLVFKKQTSSTLLSPSPSNAPLPSPITQTISYNGAVYAYEYFIVDNLKKVSLIANFKERKSSNELKTEFHCKAGINGSFYDKEGNPLGGFISGGETLKKPISSRLMDGYLSIDDTKAKIGFTPLPNSSIVLQTGPLLIVDREVTALKIVSDEQARRSIAAVTNDKNLVFLILFDPQSAYQGPYLSDLPSITKEISKVLPSPIVSAINLDGGNASAFFSESTTLTELSPVGSLFCLQ